MKYRFGHEKFSGNTSVTQRVGQNDVALSSAKKPKAQRDWSLYASRLTPNRIELFWNFVAIGGPDECWPWKGAKRHFGYGAFGLFEGNHAASAHRIAYGLANGGIPRGMHVLHSCDNPPCCNPTHLRTGTHRENMADKRGKMHLSHCKNGHEFTMENTYFCRSDRGCGMYKRCATCSRDKARKGESV